MKIKCFTINLNNNHRGGLIVSLLVGIGIIAMLTTLSIPALRKYQPNLILNSTINDMATDLRYAQQLTITEQTTHLIEFDEIGNSYQILKIEAATTTIKTVYLASGIDYQSIDGFTDQRVVFNSYGGVSEDGSVTLVNSNNTAKTITVKPSGYIQLEQ